MLSRHLLLAVAAFAFGQVQEEVISVRYVRPSRLLARAFEHAPRQVWPVANDERGIITVRGTRADLEAFKSHLRRFDIAPARVRASYSLSLPIEKAVLRGTIELATNFETVVQDERTGARLQMRVRVMRSRDLVMDIKVIHDARECSTKLNLVNNKAGQIDLISPSTEASSGSWGSLTITAT
ncbi:MAG TPA: hypothetical protein VM328_07330 [Fimbriimonadaceae bacterium]|nr:hypothetical protein [Fimbriimonadaceae bacterium]